MFNKINTFCIMTSLCFTTLVFANNFTLTSNFPNSKIENFSGSYLSPSGLATASRFEYDTYVEETPSYRIEKQGDSLFLISDLSEFQIDNLPEIIDELSSLEWSSISVESTAKEITLSIPSFSGESINKSIDISNLNLKCTARDEVGELSHLILDACLNTKGSFSFSSVSIMDKKEDKRTILDSLNLTVIKNKLNFSIKQGVTIKGDGDIFYEDDSVRIKIKKAKAGIINVTGRLFNELKKLESDSIKVERPWVEISLK
jgi:hypothetical protein